MYRRNEVISALFGRVGFRQSTIPEYAGIVSSANTESRSGRYFDGFHAIVTIQNIKEIANNDVAISNTDFNTYLSDLQKDCILGVLDGIFSEPEAIEQKMEFVRADNQPVPMPNIGRFVGRQINIGADPRKTVKINSISLFFDGAKTFNIYLFNNSQALPVKQVEVTTQPDNQVVVTPTDWFLNYGTNKAALFYLGYFQEDLGTVKAYDEQPYQWICGNCYGSQPVELIKTPAQTNFQRYAPYYTNRTHGLNVEFCSVEDYTDLIVKNQHAFDKAIGIQMAAMVVERIIHSGRSNILQRFGETGANKLYNDLNLDMTTPEMPYSSGLKNQLRRELKRLHENFFPKPKATSTTIPNLCYIPRQRPWG